MGFSQDSPLYRRMQKKGSMRKEEDYLLMHRRRHCTLSQVFALQINCPITFSLYLIPRPIVRTSGGAITLALAECLSVEWPSRVLSTVDRLSPAALLSPHFFTGQATNVTNLHILFSCIFFLNT